MAGKQRDFRLSSNEKRFASSKPAARPALRSPRNWVSQIVCFTTGENVWPNMANRLFLARVIRPRRKKSYTSFGWKMNGCEWKEKS